MNRVSFYGGVALLIVGICILIFARKAPTAQSTIEIFGFKFRSRVPAFVVMAFGIVLMLISTRFPEQFSIARAVKDFSQDGGMANYPCEGRSTSTVTYKAPAGFRIVSAQADTKDVVSSKTASAKITSQDAHQVTAQADFEGKDKDTLGLNCPGGGHGRVTVHGQIETE
jgi:hypothetical protein